MSNDDDSTRDDKCGANIKFATKSAMNCCILDTDHSIYKRLSLQTCDMLNELRRCNQLCDSVIRVDDGTEFSVHKAILSGLCRCLSYKM